MFVKSDITQNSYLYLQEDFYSTALKTLISVSTVILLGLIVAYHGLEVQVNTKKNTRGDVSQDG
jgi:potassium intermediate/small conductance calcium-activated channel subfamily N protein 3